MVISDRPALEFVRLLVARHIEETSPEVRHSMASRALSELDRLLEAPQQPRMRR